MFIVSSNLINTTPYRIHVETYYTWLADTSARYVALRGFRDLPVTFLGFSET